MCSQTEDIIGHLPTGLALSAYQKNINFHSADLPRKIRDKNSFYVSFFYKDKLVTEKIVSSSSKENKLDFPKSTSKFILDFFQDFKKKDDTSLKCSFTEKNETFALRIGHSCIIVKNHNLRAARLFAYVLGAFLTMGKALSGIKEVGSYKDLLDLAVINKHEAISYLKECSMISMAQIGGHI